MTTPTIILPLMLGATRLGCYDISDQSRGSTLRMQYQARFWRQAIGWVAVYAFVLQGILLGLAGPQLTASAAPGHELCLNDPGDDGIGPGQLPGKHDGTIHCWLCIAAADEGVTLPRVSLPAFATCECGESFSPRVGAVDVNSLKHSAHQSRAPPVAA